MGACSRRTAGRTGCVVVSFSPTFPAHLVLSQAVGSTPQHSPVAYRAGNCSLPSSFNGLSRALRRTSFPSLPFLKSRSFTPPSLPSPLPGHRPTPPDLQLSTSRSFALSNNRFYNSTAYPRVGFPPSSVSSLGSLPFFAALSPLSFRRLPRFPLSILSCSLRLTERHRRARAALRASGRSD